MSWQPIETAPKDGTNIIGAWTCLNGTWDMKVVQFYYGDWWNFYLDDKHNPTHWMPLPLPPEDTE